MYCKANDKTCCLWKIKIKKLVVIAVNANMIPIMMFYFQRKIQVKTMNIGGRIFIRLQDAVVVKS